MDTTKKLRHVRNSTVIQLDGAVGVLNNPIVATTKHSSRTASRHHARELAAELVRRFNHFHALVEALENLVHTIEIQAETNFLNEDADEGEANDLTRARAALKAAKG